MTYISNN